MNTIPSFLSPVSYFLADPSKKANVTEVFIRIWTSEKILGTSQALQFLRKNVPFPLTLKKVSVDGLTVKVRVSKIPRIEFGRGPFSGNTDSDLQEIRDVLKGNGIETVLAN